MTLPSRSILDNELQSLTNNLLKMSSLVDQAIEQAMLALETQNVANAEKVINGDGEINAIRYVIEEMSLRILATQHPMARDLRRVIASIHLAIELERMGDHASGIARLVQRMANANEAPVLALSRLPKMAKRARKMLDDAIQSFIHQDITKAHSLVQRDEKLDRQYQKFFQESLSTMEEESHIRESTFLLWVSHNLERIGDRATNIAERVVFMVTGQFIESFDDLETSLYLSSEGDSD
jgi:phosphate transport system protein